MGLALSGNRFFKGDQKKMLKLVVVKFKVVNTSTTLYLNETFEKGRKERGNIVN